MENIEYNHDLAVKAQKELADKNNHPHFAPKSGYCYNCGKSIYIAIEKGSYKSGITLERAKTELVTGCPHCHRSFCD